MTEPLDEAKIEEAVIDDSREMGLGPFKLVMGQSFKLKTWVQAIQEMQIGEVSRYYCPYTASCLSSSESTCNKSMQENHVGGNWEVT